MEAARGGGARGVRAGAGVPFGEIEGVGLSDPSKLADVYGWSARQIATRYENLATACVVIVALGWTWAVWSARKIARGSAS